MSNKNFVNVTTDGDIADEIGSLKAEIKSLQDQQKFLEGLLKHKHVKVAEGSLFRVSISYDVEQVTIGWKAIAEKLNPSRQLVAAHTKRSSYDRVTVSSHKKVN